MQVRNERAEECGKTAYKPVAKVMAIAPMPIMVKIRPKPSALQGTPPFYAWS